MKKLSSILLCGLILILSSCEKDTESANFAPVVTTGSADNIYRMGATLSGSIQLTETCILKEYGILLSELESMAEYIVYPIEDGSKDFSISVQSLEPGKTYYYCAYASSGYSIVRDQIESFTTTKSDTPIFDELIILDYDDKNCRVSVNIFDDGGSDIILSGFVWKEADSVVPTIYDNVTNVQIQDHSMSCTITGMKPNKTYSVRAYAQNQSGLNYSNSITFTTSATILPVLSNVLSLDSTEIRVMVKSAVINMGLDHVTRFGFCYSPENENPTTNHYIMEGIQDSNQDFIATIGNLEPWKTYYIRAFAENEKETGYSETYRFTTREIPLIGGDEVDLHVLAGGLSDYINNIAYYITKLKVSGYLNGDDIRLIREMAGSKDYYWTNGSLRDLDISQATIVTGGGPYRYDTHITNKNVLGDYMFSDTRLKKILLPANLTAIGQGAFDDCSSLTSIVIPNGVISIGPFAFSGCSSLTTIEIPKSVISIGEQAFKNCFSLTSITIPNSITSIESGTFWDCHALTSITIPDGVTDIGYFAFSGCSSLTSIDIPDGVTTIHDAAFYCCSSLTSIDIPNGVTDIGTSAFYGCSSLSNIIIPDGVTYIASNAFAYCSSLTSINIPNEVIDIGDSSFYGCSSLTSIEIPENVIWINSSAFRLCSSLEKVTCNAINPPRLFNSVFSEIPLNATLYVPAEAYDAYTASDWVYYFSSIKIINT